MKNDIADDSVSPILLIKSFVSYQFWLVVGIWLWGSVRHVGFNLLVVLMEDGNSKVRSCYGNGWVNTSVFDLMKD